MTLNCPKCKDTLRPTSRYFALLTGTQQDIADGIIRGKGMDEIAADLGKEKHNIAVQINLALRTLNLTNCVQLTLLAYGILNGEDLGLDNALRAYENGVSRRHVTKYKGMGFGTQQRNRSRAMIGARE